MQVDNRRNHRQSQPESWVTMTFFAAIKAFQHRFTLALGNSRAAVLHLDAHHAGLIAGTHAYGAAGRGKFDRIAQ
ncbi:hypothetical protein D3C77_682620 [compost metagenome]